jgi:hypothetical protein
MYYNYCKSISLYVCYVCRSGAISALEFHDRFFSIFGQYAAAELLYLQMVLLVPVPPKRLQLLQLAKNVSQEWVRGEGGF